MARGMLERVLNPEQLDHWFDTTVKAQYTKDLLFSTLFNLMSQVVQGNQRSIHAAFQASKNAWFIIREHGNYPVERIGAEKYIGKIETGTVYEQRILVRDEAGQEHTFRRTRVKLKGEKPVMAITRFSLSRIFQERSERKDSRAIVSGSLDHRNRISTPCRIFELRN